MKDNKERVIWIVAIIILLIASFIVTRPSPSSNNHEGIYRFKTGQYDFNTYFKHRSANVDDTRSILNRYKSEALNEEVDYFLRQDITIDTIGFTEVTIIEDKVPSEAIVLFNLIGIKDDDYYVSSIVDMTDYFKEALNKESQVPSTDYYALVVDDKHSLDAKELSNHNFRTKEKTKYTLIYELDPFRSDDEVYTNSMHIRSVCRESVMDADVFGFASTFLMNTKDDLKELDLYDDYLSLRLVDLNLNDWQLICNTTIR